jgi:hypothetical protein
MRGVVTSFLDSWSDRLVDDQCHQMHLHPHHSSSHSHPGPLTAFLSVLGVSKSNSGNLSSNLSGNLSGSLERLHITPSARNNIKNSNPNPSPNPSVNPNQDLNSSQTPHDNPLKYPNAFPSNTFPSTAIRTEKSSPETNPSSSFIYERQLTAESNDATLQDQKELIEQCDTKDLHLRCECERPLDQVKRPKQMRMFIRCMKATQLQSGGGAGGGAAAAGLAGEGQTAGGSNATVTPVEGMTKWVECESEGKDLEASKYGGGGNGDDGDNVNGGDSENGGGKNDVAGGGGNESSSTKSVNPGSANSGPPNSNSPKETSKISRDLRTGSAVCVVKNKDGTTFSRSMPYGKGKEDGQLLIDDCGECTAPGRVDVPEAKVRRQSELTFSNCHETNLVEWIFKITINLIIG